MFDAREERAPATKSSTIGLGIMLLLGGFVLNHIFSRKSLGPRLGVATTTASLFITLSGVVLGVIGLTSLPFYRALRVAFLVSMAVSILYLPSYLGIQFIQTGADRLGECPGLGQAAANSQVIPQSLSRPENPAVGCGVERRGMFLSYYNTLSVMA